MKIKTSEATPNQINYLVAVCEGVINGGDDLDIGFVLEGGYTPSTDWEEGGAIIEREGIKIMRDPLGVWVALPFDADFSEEAHQLGDTLLIAAMRCFVASKLGDEVDIPNEILEN